MHDKGFSKADLTDALVREGIIFQPDGDFTRRVMQHLKQVGLIAYDAAAGIWNLTDLGHMRLPGKTLPLLQAGAVVQSSSMPVLSTPPTNRWANIGRHVLSILACFSLIAAQITLNASFAWELGGEAPQFRAAFVVALMALDLMRPFLVAAGFSYLGRGKAVLSIVAISVALVLSPVSILSSTSILSASFLLGAEMNSDADIRTETRVVLQLEHARLLDRAAGEEAAWQLECTRGGCGPVAEELETQFQATITEAKTILDRIIVLADVEQGNSALLARMVTTFEGLGLFGAGRQILLPLLLAISLEIAALFGPALLLGKKTY